MFNKSILKQCIRSNGKLWILFTIVACVMCGFYIGSYDASSFQSIASAASGTNLSGIASHLSSLLGTMEMAYKMILLLIGMVYVLLTANNLIASEVDSGSMAYTLSTPCKRSSVVITKMTYLIGAVVLMFGIITGVNLAVTQATQHCVTDNPVTEDVKAAAEAMDRSSSYVKDHLYVIKDDKYALKDAAKARDMDSESYSIYLDQRMLKNSYKKAAKELTSEREDTYKDSDMDDDEIEITKEELEKDPSLMLNSNDSLKAGADCMGMTVTEYKSYIQDIIDQKDSKKKSKSKSTQNNSAILNTAMGAAASALDTDTGTIQDNMIWMKDSKALKAEAKATGLKEAQLKEIINQTMASSALSADESSEFDLTTYLWLNVGCCLLILAFAAIGFFASCLFNRAGTAMMLGGGLPFAFYLFNIIVQMGGDNMENAKYLTLVTLYDTSEIIAQGDFGVGLAILAGIAVVLYTAGCVIFCKKDLPL